MDHYSRFQSLCPETMLVQQAQAGNRFAFDRLVRSYRSLLLGLAYMRTSNMETADDLVQEVLARAWQKLPNLQNPTAFPAWLKTITTNVCSHWHGRFRSPSYLTEEPVYETLVDSKPMPLDVLLAQEKRQELDQALSSLPVDNRLALVLYALEGFSYQEIADLTGVPLSTIDGRIRRARALLRRLLANHDDSGRPGASSSVRLPTRNPYLPQPRRESMTPVAQQQDPSTQAHALTLFTHRLATLVEAGIPVARALDALRDVPSPYGNASGEMSMFLQETIPQDSAPIFSSERMYLDWLHNPDRYPTLIQHLTSAVDQQRYLLPNRSQGLAKALTQHSGLFSQYYIDVVYHGDNAGLLDATLRHLATLLEKQWQLANNRPEGEEPVLFFLPAGKPLAKDWSGLSAYQQRVTLELLLHGFATMLVCNVPILHAMRLMAAILPETQAEIWLTACQDIRNGDPIAPSLIRMAVFPDFVIQLISIGEEMGTLDFTLAKAAELIEYEKRD